MTAAPSNVELLELEIDIRLAELWQEAESLGFSSHELHVFATFIRAAYGQGWTDALREPRGKLARDHGFSIGPRRPR